jgi:hypothetical protein
MISLVVLMTLVTHCIGDKSCDVIIMYNRSCAMCLLLSVDYKKKIKIYYWFFAVLFSKKKAVASHENLDNSTYDLTGKVEALQTLSFHFWYIVMKYIPSLFHCNLCPFY